MMTYTRQSITFHSKRWTNSCQLLSIMMKTTLLVAIILALDQISVCEGEIVIDEMDDLKLKQRQISHSRQQDLHRLQHRHRQQLEQHHHHEQNNMNHQPSYYKIPQRLHIHLSRTTSMKRNIFGGEVDEDDDRHNRDPEDEDKSNPPAPPDYTFIPSMAPSSFPSFEPTSIPSLTPSNLPSRSPTVYPSIAPSASPSDLPSDSPSVHPSIAATMSPSSSPSKSPTVYPSINHSTIPSSSLSKIPTTFPSTTPLPSATTTTSPTCFDGITGEARDFGNTDTDPIVISYFYEIETDRDCVVPIETDVLPYVEEAIAEMLARSYLGITCGSGSTAVGRREKELVRRRRRNQIESSETMLGLSSSPQDKALSESCEVETENFCTVIDGRISVYLEGTSAEATKKDCLEKIKDEMDNGNLLYAHKSLQKLTYISGRIEIVVDDDNGPFIPGTDDVTEIDNDVWTVGYIAGILLGSTCLICSILMARFALRLPDEYDEEEFESSRWREISNSSLAIVSYDDQTIHASNKEIDVTLREDGTNDDYGDLQLYQSSHAIYDKQDRLEESKNDYDTDQNRKNHDHDFNDDDLNVNVDLEDFESRTRKEKDGCFDFFDLVLETGGVGNKRRNNILDPDERSHLSELSY